jgi:hypothetical protein
MGALGPGLRALQKFAELLCRQACSFQDAGEKAARYISASVHRNVREAPVAPFENNMGAGRPINVKACAL